MTPIRSVKSLTVTPRCNGRYNGFPLNHDRSEGLSPLTSEPTAFGNGGPAETDWRAMSTLPDPSRPSIDPGSTEGQQPARNALITPITSPHEKSTAYYLARRLHLAFSDLGLRDHIRAGWVQPGADCLVFGSLTVAQADKFVLAVEDVAHGYRPRTPSVSPDQLGLF